MNPLVHSLIDSLVCHLLNLLRIALINQLIQFLIDLLFYVYLVITFSGSCSDHCFGLFYGYSFVFFSG